MDKMAHILLQSHALFDEMALLDPERQTFRAFSRRAEPRLAALPIRGAFERIGNTTVMLFREDEKMYLQIGDRRMKLDDCRVELMKDLAGRFLRVFQGNQCIFETECNPPSVTASLFDDPTPFVEMEDFDFGLFLYNVSRYPMRQSRMYL